MWFLLFDDDDDDDEDDDYVTVGSFGTTCWDMFEILLIGLVYPVHDVTTCYQPTDRQSDELQELLEWIFATKKMHIFYSDSYACNWIVCKLPLYQGKQQFYTTI